MITIRIIQEYDLFGSGGLLNEIMHSSSIPSFIIIIHK
jgi:hypothetical protein